MDPVKLHSFVPDDDRDPAGDERLRAIPAVHEVVESAPLRPWHERLPREVLVATARRVLAEHRERLLSGGVPTTSITAESLAAEIATRLEQTTRPALPTVINATGILIHTGLGRVPLAPEAVAALTEAAQGYTALELDLETGQRGRRSGLIRELLCNLTSAESATVVNNTAAAILIALSTALSTAAHGRKVLVSRGELIEIGGSFRLPEIMKASGATLVEVGTTNKTRVSDYENAIDDTTAALLKVHPSNYEVSGFVESVGVDELATVAERHALPLIHDIGSGVLADLSCLGLAGEPVARASIEAGADLVLFSGDKLLGGPQAGLIVGRKAWIERIEKNPLMRALRVDKLTLAALTATLQIHLSAEVSDDRLPIFSMASESVESLTQRAERVVGALAAEVDAELGIVSAQSCVGGGTLPRQNIKSVAVEIRTTSYTEGELARRLRLGTPAVVSRVQGGAVLLDMRTVMETQVDALISAIRAALVSSAH